MDTGHDADARSDPYVVPDDDLAAFEDIPVRQIVIVCHDGHMRADLDIVPEFDSADGHGSEVVIDKNIFSKGDLLRKIDLCRRKDSEPFRNLSVKQLAESPAPFFRLRFRMVQMKEYEKRTTVFSRLGLDFDLFEGIYASAWEGSCRFLELARTPVCCGVSRNHRLAKASGLSMQDLSGEVLVMPIQGVSEELDTFREEIAMNYPSTKIIDSDYYGVDTFALCEMNSYILITQPVYEDIHPNLITIPLQTDASMPYGLVYAKEPTAAAAKFIHAVEKILK